MKTLCKKIDGQCWGVINNPPDAAVEMLADAAVSCDKLNGEYIVIEDFSGAYVQDNTLEEDALKNY